MERVKAQGKWSLFDPNEAPGLADTYGAEFEALYTKYEEEGRARKTINAQDVWFAILDSQIETGTPYMLYKDAANRKSNQKNLGTIKCSNLCTEIIEYTSPEETAVCNLASIALPMFVSDGKFNHKRLAEVTKVVTRNLNKIIDVNFYPVESCRTSNMRHRPIGIGIQGLADVFIMLRMPFDCDEARQLNKEIFETMYFAALTASNELAKQNGPYESFPGSPLSQGIFQFDMWNVKPASDRWDWEGLRKEVMEHGTRNSLLLAPMPTASTSQILGNCECFEPYTSNIYSRRVLAGEFTVVNQHLLKDLIELNLWTPELKNKIVAGNGSVQHCDEIPDDLKAIYRTVWEIKQRSIITMAAERGAYIDQSQSMSVFMEGVNSRNLTSLHFAAWGLGLKTGMYYLRTRPAADAIKFTVDQEALQRRDARAAEAAAKEEEMEGMVCTMEEGCISCGS